MLQRDVQKIAAAAGRVEHAGGAQLVVEPAHLGPGLFAFGLEGLATQLGGLVRQHQRGGLGVQPVGAQRLDHGGQHQPFDIGARRVVRAKRVALGRVERALQQGTEDGRLNLAPVAVGGIDQTLDLLLIQ